MIVPMKKVSLITLSERKADTLQKLRRLGLVQIEITEGRGEDIPRLREQIAALERCAASLGKPEKGAAPAGPLAPEEALAIAGEIAALEQEKQDCRARQGALQAELSRLAPWGEVDPAGLRVSRGGAVSSGHSNRSACSRREAVSRPPSRRMVTSPAVKAATPSPPSPVRSPASTIQAAAVTKALSQSSAVTPGLSRRARESCTA